MTTLNDTRFGTIEYNDQDMLNFNEGLIGLPNLRNFLLLQHKEKSPFRWLQSVDEPSLAFLIGDPWHFLPPYDVEIKAELAEELELAEEGTYTVWTTVTIPGGNTQEMTINLAAPIVINLNNRRGQQVVLEGEAYNIRHRVFPQAESEPLKQAA